MPDYIEISTGDSVHVDFDGFRTSICRRDVDQDGGFSVELQGPGEEREPLLRWDIFRKDPHYHVPASERKQIGIDTNSPEESLDFLIACFASRLPELLRQGAYPELAEKVDQSQMARVAEEVRKLTLRVPEPSSTQRIELTPEIRKLIGQ
jgi:hypothetical protein